MNCDRIAVVIVVDWPMGGVYLNTIGEQRATRVPCSVIEYRHVSRNGAQKRTSLHILLPWSTNPWAALYAYLGREDTNPRSGISPELVLQRAKRPLLTRSMVPFMVDVPP